MILGVGYRQCQNGADFSEKRCRARGFLDARDPPDPLGGESRIDSRFLAITTETLYPVFYNLIVVSRSDSARPTL